MRIYISADIEGIAGVVSKEHMRPGGYEYEEARDWMTAAVVEACEAARDAGAIELVVSDSHGNGLNIRPDALPDFVNLVRSWPRPLGMMQGIETGQYDGALLLGYHAGSTNKSGLLSHTISSEFYHAVEIGGQPVSEADISAMIAARYGVPVLLVAGDDVVVADTLARRADIATAILKTAVGGQSAMALSPRATLPLVREAVTRALGLVGRVAPFAVPDGPFDLILRLRTRAIAEWMSYIEPVERLDAFTILYPARDILAASKFLMFLPTARAALG